MVGKDTIAKIINTFINPYYKKENTIHKNDLSLEPSIGHIWKIKKFATPLKQFLSILTGITLEDFEKEEIKNSYLGEEWKIKVIDPCCNDVGIESYADSDGKCSNCGEYIVTYKNITVREAMQLIGTDLFRNKFHPNTFVNALFKDYVSKESLNTSYAKAYSDNMLPLSNWIISDLRFKNEIKAIQDRKGIIIKVERNLYQYEDVVLSWKDLNKIIFDNTGEYPIKQYADKHWLIKSNHFSETGLDNWKNYDFLIDNNGTIEELIEKVKNILLKLKLL